MRAGLVCASLLLSLVACDSDGVTPVCSDAATSCTGTAVARDAAAERDFLSDDDAALADANAEASVDLSADAESDAGSPEDSGEAASDVASDVRSDVALAAESGAGT